MARFEGKSWKLFDERRRKIGRILKELAIETATPNEDHPRVRNPAKPGVLVDSPEIPTNG
jgi:hypothetical protein